MEFDIRNYPGKYVMHCKTEEEAYDFLAYLHSIGRRWCSGDSYLVKTRWDEYKAETAYNFNQGAFADISYYTSNGYLILEWSDFSGIAKEKPKPQPAISESSVGTSFMSS